MEVKKQMKTGCILALLCCFPLFGCATDDSYTSESQQSVQGMGQQGGGGGMGRGGGGGMGGGKGGQQGPPNRQDEDNDPTSSLPDEAFTACVDKQAGEYVYLKLPDGKELKATCQVIDEHMVALPEQTKKSGPPR
ncbi:hypothetical protein [Desulforhopalus sp. 52FAK]